MIFDSDNPPPALRAYIRQMAHSDWESFSPRMRGYLYNVWVAAIAWRDAHPIVNKYAKMAHDFGEVPSNALVQLLKCESCMEPLLYCRCPVEFTLDQDTKRLNASVTVRRT